MATHSSILAWRISWTEPPSVQFSAVAQSCPTLCDPTNRSRSGLPVHHQLRSPPKPMSIESMMPSKSRLVGYNPWGRSCDRTERLMLNLAMGEFLSLGSRIAYSSSDFVCGPLWQLVYSESCGNVKELNSEIEMLPQPKHQSKIFLETE